MEENPKQPLEHESKPVPPPQQQQSSNSGFLERTSVYGLELGVAMVTMVIIAIVLAVGSFSLAEYLYGSVNTGLGEVALWSAASTIVWLPVVYIFYMRSRAYMARHPEINNNQTQRAFVLLYQVITLLTVIAFAFAAVYSLLNAFVQAENMGRTLVTVSLPSGVAAVLFGGAFVAFFRRPVLGRVAFGRSLLVVSLLITVPVIFFSMVMLRSANMDDRKSDDLQSIDSALRTYYRSNRELPTNLDDAVNRNSTIDGSLSDYEYSKKSDRQFELCANFATDTTDDVARSSYRLGVGYVDYYSHNKGKQCYTEQVTGSSLYYDPEYEAKPTY